jgi:hypothetical protein
MTQFPQTFEGWDGLFDAGSNSGLTPPLRFTAADVQYNAGFRWQLIISTERIGMNTAQICLAFIFFNATRARSFI